MQKYSLILSSLSFGRVTLSLSLSFFRQGYGRGLPLDSLSLSLSLSFSLFCCKAKEGRGPALPAHARALGLIVPSRFGDMMGPAFCNSGFPERTLLSALSFFISFICSFFLYSLSRSLAGSLALSL